ncbi:MAG: hypothetical protein ACYSUK_04435 [Planctomycetota bacterium]|jgi:low affinity Fe/Cu permease
MKKHLVPITIISLLLALTLVCFAQERGSDRMRRYRESQLASIAAIQEKLDEMKADLEGLPEMGSWEDLSDEEREDMRDKFMQMREKRQQAMAAMGDQMTKLAGGRAYRDKHQTKIDSLNSILSLAKKEEAKETIDALEALIAQQEQKYQATVETLGLRMGRGRDRE